MKCILALITFTSLVSLNAMAAKSISCDRTEIEDEGPVVLSFAGNDNQILALMEESPGVDAPASEVRRFPKVAEVRGREWPLGTYAGTARDGSHVSVTIDAILVPRIEFAQYGAMIVESVRRGPGNYEVSVSPATCYEYESEE